MCRSCRTSTREKIADPTSCGGLPHLLVILVYAAERANGWAEPVCFPLSSPNAKGTKFALAPLYLWSLYAQPDKCITREAQDIRCDKTPDSNFLQMVL